MITEQHVLDDLIMAAKLKGNDTAVTDLLEGIKNCEHEILKGAAAKFDEMFQDWDDTVGASDEKAKVCLALAEASALDTPYFRAALNDAARRMLPPYISSSAVARAIGARDTGITVASVASRIHRLQQIRTNAYVFQTESQCWGRMTNCDKVMATIAVNTFATNSMISIPIAKALSGCLFFEQHIEITNFIATNASNLHPAAYYREMLAKHSIGKISEDKIRSLLEKMFIPSIISADNFEKWWNDTAPAHTVVMHRSFVDSRSILELHNLLEPLTAEEIKVDEAAAAKLAVLFSKVRANLPPKDLVTLAETISVLANSGSNELLAKMYAPLRGKVPFFPKEINNDINLKNLEIWGRLSMKLLSGFIKAASCLYTTFETAKLFTKLPLRCMTPMLDVLSPNDVTDAIYETEKPGCDILLCIWKNKNRFPELKEYLNMQNIARALSEDELPKEWAAAQRELKKLLFDKTDFQKQILDNAGENVASIVYAVQKMRNMQSGECQSLLVKLSRISEALKARLESGMARKVLGAREETEQADNSALMTSLASYKRLVDELDDLVRVKIPENVKAIETARAFGDLSENAEYDAAKLQRSILRKRRSELERDIATVQAIDFSEFKPALTMVSLVSSVTLELQDGKAVEYHIVGAFDGKPELNYIAYNTLLGKTLLGKKTGDTVALPEGGNAKITKISAFSKDLLNVFAAEE